jgi:hypothetical protein
MILIIDTDSPELLTVPEAFSEIHDPVILTSGNTERITQLEDILAHRRVKPSLLKLLNPRKIPGFGKHSVLLIMGRDYMGDPGKTAFVAVTDAEFEKMSKKYWDMKKFMKEGRDANTD